MEKEAVFQAIQELNAWYSFNDYIIVKAGNSTASAWVVERLPAYHDGAIDPTPENIRRFNQQRLAEFSSKGLGTDAYFRKLKTRADMDGPVQNLGMLLTGHKWGDWLTGFIVDGQRLEYLPHLDEEGQNPVFERNLSAAEVKQKHLERIMLPDADTATYTLFYTEAGLGVVDRENAFITATFKKAAAGHYKVNDITIQEVNEQDVLDFLKKITD